MNGKLALAALLVSAQAIASGFYYGDNGAKSLLQGGAFTAQADDLSAIQHNPAGLAQLDGINFLADTQWLHHTVVFQRQDPGFDPANPSTLAAVVENKGTTSFLPKGSGIFFLPYASGSYSLPIGPRTLTLALGAYTPPSVGAYAYPAPNYARNLVFLDSAGQPVNATEAEIAAWRTNPSQLPAGAARFTNNYAERPNKYSPQRYTLVDNDIFVLFPTLSAGIDVLPRKLMVGVSAQVTLSHFFFRQAMYSGLSTPTNLATEDPIFDSVVSVSIAGRPAFTGVVGALYKPTDTLAFGASVRPPVPILATGTLDIGLGEAATGLNTTVIGTRDPTTGKLIPTAASLVITLPLEIRLGARYKPMPRLGINADFVYQGWDAIQDLTLRPQGVTLTIGSGAPQAVEPFPIPKKWKGSFSGRLGGSFDVFPFLTAHAGVFYETSSSPDQYLTVDFAHPDRLYVSAGLSARVSHFEFVGGFIYNPPTTKYLVASEARQGQTDSTIQGSVIGAGIMTMGGWIVNFGVRGHFGKAAEAPRPTPAPEPAPAPAAAPPPAPETVPPTVR